MSAKNNRYRNPSPPVGHIKKEVVFKEKSEEDEVDLDDLLDKLMKSGIFEEPDVTIYEHFSINPSSEEDEIVEIPVEPRQVELVVIDDGPDQSGQNEPVIVKQEPKSPTKHLTPIEKGHEQSASAATPAPATEKKKKLGKKSKKDSRGHHSKQRKDHRGKVGDTKRYSSDEDSDHSHQSRRRRDHREKIGDTKRYPSDDDRDYTSQRKSENRDIDSKFERLKITKKKLSYAGDNRKRSPSPSPSTSRDYSKREKKGMRTDDYSSGEDFGDYPTDKNKERGRKGTEETKKTKSEQSKKKQSPPPCSSKMKDYSHKKLCLDVDSGDDYSYGKKSEKISSDKDVDDHSRFVKSEHFEDFKTSIRNIKEEMNLGAMLPGVYRCEVCNLTLNSESTYNSHIVGKRHQKAVTAKNVSNYDYRESVAPLPVSKYPKPPNGYYRMKVKERAKAQPQLDKTLTTPCPGLENVIEIQGIIETQYYCELCNAVCNVNSIYSHLSGYKHQLNALRHFRADLYNVWSYKQKYQIESDLLKELGSIERRQGRGELTVEREFPESNWSGNEAGPSRGGPPKKTVQNKPGTSHDSDQDFIDTYKEFSKPDPSISGFYCRLCDSHSNSEAMWANHITGKRHLANIRKAPGTAPSKRKYIAAAEGTRPLLFGILDEENTDCLPVVGLGQIREIRKPDIKGVTFNCFLCSACVSHIDIVAHILSRKHREKYLESIKHPEFEMLRSCQVSDFQMDSVITEICSRVEAEEGTGTPDVFFDKSAVRRGGVS